MGVKHHTKLPIVITHECCLRIDKIASNICLLRTERDTSATTQDSNSKLERNILLHRHPPNFSGPWVRSQRTLVIPCIITHITSREQWQPRRSFAAYAAWCSWEEFYYCSQNNREHIRIFSFRVCWLATSYFTVNTKNIDIFIYTGNKRYETMGMI